MAKGPEGDEDRAGGSSLEDFAKALFRGMTLPFPALRSLADSPPAAAAGGTTSSPDGSEGRIGLSLRECLLAIGAYLSLGVAAYSSDLLQAEPWSLADALYFSVVTFTTVGYGDLCPTTPAAKVFTVLFAAIGISILGAAIATITSSVLEKQADALQAAQQAGRRKILEFWKRPDKIRDVADALASPVGDSISDDAVPSWLRTGKSILKAVIPSLSVLLVGGLALGRIEGWAWQDSLYYSFVTASTLGYGDFSPSSQKGRLWAVIFIPLAVGAAGEILGGVATWLLKSRLERFYQRQLERELNIERLLEMDADGNEKVTREEYVAFMLKEMQLVEDDVFRELHNQFEELDATRSGYLDKEDLRILAEKRHNERAQQGTRK